MVQSRLYNDPWSPEMLIGHAREDQGERNLPGKPCGAAGREGAALRGERFFTPVVRGAAAWTTEPPDETHTARAW